MVNDSEIIRVRIRGNILTKVHKMTAILETLTAIDQIDRKTWNWRGYNIIYTVKGTGQSVLLIHGFGASIGHWRKNIDEIAAGGYRVYALDLLGFGASTKAPIDYGMELWAEMVADFADTHIQEPAFLVGNSIGGLITLTTLANRPDLCAGAILINCAGGLTHRPTDLNWFVRQIMTIFMNVVRSPAFGPLIFNRIRSKRNIRKSLSQVYFRKEAITDELVELLYQPSCDPGAQKVFAAVISAAPGTEPRDLLESIECPLLVIWGDKDPWTPIKGIETFRKLQEQGKQVELFTIPGGGHCPHDEYPEVVNPAILNWLAKF
jgi:pimeloyl-ACP methyl ester carboxylesterase